MLYDSPTELYESFYEDLAKIYMNENENPYQIDENGLPVAYERWKASKSKKRLPDLLLSKIKVANSAMLDIKFWQETWAECFDIEKREIDKEGFARYIFQNRKRIIESKQYPCKNCLGRCFATLCLCEHLWQEHNLLLNPEVNAEILKAKVMPDIHPLEEYVKEEYTQIYPLLWNRIFDDTDVLHLLKETNPNTFTGGYNQKLTCNLVGLLCGEGVYDVNPKQADTLIYTGKTHYTYINNYANYNSSDSELTREEANAIKELIKKHT